MALLRLGTRGSALAQRQAAEAAAALHAQGIRTEIAICTTQGDRDTDGSLQVIGGQGVFVREIEEALLAGRIDAAVHSAKDMPPLLLAGTEVAAYLPRADVRDVLVSRDGQTLAALPAGARVGSSSSRRWAQLLAVRPDLIPDEIRGNVDTRLAKVERGDYDAVLLAAAGLQRLDRLEVVTEYLPVDVMVPAPGQGAIALQARADDRETIAALQRLNHRPTSLAVRAERAFLAALGAGCLLPVAALAHVRGDLLTIVGLVANGAGSRIIKSQRSGDAAAPEAVGRSLGEAMIAQGALDLLHEVVR